MDLGLRGRTAIVCGASAGIGLGCAEALAGEGANVVMLARGAEALEREAVRLGALAVPGDVTSAADLERLVERTAKGGGELVNLLGTSAWYAPGAAAAQMVDAIVLDEKRVLPCTAYLEGEYGIEGLYMGVPVVLGSKGIERIVELDLDEAEQQALKASADAVRDVVSVLTT